MSKSKSKRTNVGALFEIEMLKKARCCGAKQVSKSTCTKYVQSISVSVHFGSTDNAMWVMLLQWWVQPRGSHWPTAGSGRAAQVLWRLAMNAAREGTGVKFCMTSAKDDTHREVWNMRCPAKLRDQNRVQLHQYNLNGVNYSTATAKLELQLHWSSVHRTTLHPASVVEAATATTKDHHLSVHQRTRPCITPTRISSSFLSLKLLPLLCAVLL